MTNKVLDFAILEITNRQLAIQNEQNQLLQKINFVFNQLKDELDIDAIRAQIKTSLSSDLDNFHELNKQLSNANNADIPFAIRTNKMVEICEGSLDLCNHNYGDKDSLDYILNGQLPEDYSNDAQELPVMGEASYWGTSKVSFISNTLHSYLFCSN